MTVGKHIKKDVIAYIRNRGAAGVTWKDVAKRFSIHHGGASARLSTLHKAGTISRLTESRDGCKIYVYPTFVEGRPLDEFQGRDKVHVTAKATTSDSQTTIAAECDSIRDLLLEKNAKYGDSALHPKRVFSKSSPTEQILVRIDDKLSRIATTGFSAADEDTLTDLIGYLVLLKVQLAMEDE